MLTREILDDFAAPTANLQSPWLQVLGGTAFDLVNPRADQVDFVAGAKVLARTPRFGGHTEDGVLSVAQHQHEGGEAIVRDGHGRLASAAFRIHDFHEAIIGDKPTPISEATIALAIELSGGGPAMGVFLRDVFREQKQRLDAAIYAAAGLPWPLPQAVRDVVHEYDQRLCVTEHAARMKPAPRLPWHNFGDVLPVQGCDLYPWSEGTVATIYLQGLREFLPALGGSI